MKNFLLILALLICLSAKGQSKDTINIDEVVPNKHILTFSLEDEPCFILMVSKKDTTLNLKLNGEDISAIISHGLIKAEKPYSIVKHQHALIVYKNGKRIGAFKYFQSEIHLTNLIVQ